MFKKIMSVALCAAMVAGFATVASADETWKLGAIGPLTGPAADYGLNAIQGIQVAVDEINENGGIAGVQIEYNPQDDEHDAEKSVNAYNTLKDWGMQALIGTVTTAPCIAVSAETAADNMFEITPSASSEDVLNQGDNCFQVCFTDPNQGIASAQFIGENFTDVTKVGIIYNASDIYSSGIHDTFFEEAENQPFEIVADTAFTADSNTDFSAQIGACKDAGAELVFLPFYYNEASIVLKQAADVEYAPIWFGVDGMDGILSVEGFDTTLAEGVLLLTPFAADATDDATVNFVTRYEAAYGATPSQFAADGYDCVYVVKELIESKGLTPDMSVSDLCDAMKAAMTEITVEGITGTMTWTADGKVSKSPAAVVISDGAYVAFENYNK